jgi:hypothetical protein
MKLAVKAHSVLNQIKKSYSLSDRKNGTNNPTKTRIKIISERFIWICELRFSNCDFGVGVLGMLFYNSYWSTTNFHVIQFSVFTADRMREADQELYKHVTRE